MAEGKRSFKSSYLATIFHHGMATSLCAVSAKGLNRPTHEDDRCLNRVPSSSAGGPDRTNPGGDRLPSPSPVFDKEPIATLSRPLQSSFALHSIALPLETVNVLR
jgi:hypothetical protein